MIQRLKQQVGPVVFVALEIVLAAFAFALLCVALKASLVPGLSLALRSFLYMLPFGALGAAIILAVRSGHLGSRVGTPILALLFALSVGTVLILWADRNPYQAYVALLEGSLTSLKSISETLVCVTPLILTGLSIALSFRVGLFNIGAEGQFLMGQMGAAWAGYAFKGLPLIIHLPLTFLCGILAGGLWAALPGFLKAKRGVHEVINCIMMNYIALYFTHYLVIGPLMAPGFMPVTREIANTAKLPRLLAWLDPSLRVNAGLFLSLLAVVVVYWLLWKTTTGYEIRAVGLNPHAAKYGGISVSKNIILAMVLSGGLAGLAGAVQVMGIQYKFIDAFQFPGYGLDGIAVALLGNNHPFGVIFGAFLFGTLNTGASRMQLTADVPKQIIVIVQAIIIFFVAAEYMVRRLVERKKQAQLTPDKAKAGKEVAGA